MNFRIQFMTAIALCFATFTFGSPMGESTCNVSLAPAGIDTKIPPGWPAGSSHGYICGSSQNNNPAVAYHQCRTCRATAVGEQCKLFHAAKSPTLPSVPCNLGYGPMDSVYGGRRSYYCHEGAHAYMCSGIGNASVCDECAPYQFDISDL
ncbi:uncharacterized protein MELLADRAFT_87923 [Melampsora larici-populina 98AG31]|uniref:Secreted protein n=1 Tax=Melampsora larici-populina (strain 98AG31 / pathotype 3-4-7) TaxID=747676 RepID=F4RQ06_MELLP|nr:uncharacterized protein MELLADRAFT_87923 [Melampsora larici-populina 98AG31]EGG05639.1 secreted protein [Melampsora larici-populina 98AG31]